MSEPVGRTMPVSLGRRIVTDFLHISKQIPLVTVQRDMNVAELTAVRSTLRTRPSWSSIFTKAYARVVAARPDLRRAFLTFPYERIFEYTDTTADIVIEARIDGADTLVTVPMIRPDTRPLLELDRKLLRCKDAPLERIRQYKKANFLARFPAAIRRTIWWLILNGSGYKRARYFGTFGITSVGNWGVESLRPLAPWITTIHYGTIAANGDIAMRMTYDHRVLDGSGPATALLEFERMLATDIVVELKSLADGEAMTRAA